MAEPSGSSVSSSSPPSERLFEESLPALSEPFEGQNFELVIVLSDQPLSSCPPHTFDSRSCADLDSESPDNPVRTPGNSLTIDGHLGLVIYPLNPLFYIVEISPGCPYSLYD